MGTMGDGSDEVISRIKNQESRIKNQESRIKNQEKIKKHFSKNKNSIHPQG